MDFLGQQKTICKKQTHPQAQKANKKKVKRQSFRRKNCLFEDFLDRSCIAKQLTQLERRTRVVDAQGTIRIPRKENGSGEGVNT